MKKAVTVLIALIVALACASTAQAQPVNLDERLKALSSLGAPTADAEYRLGPGDLIEVSVFGVADFRHTVRISAAGAIKLPLLEALDVSGMTPAELEQRLTALLQDEVIKNPQVSVFVKEYRSQPVVVLGAVKNPGQYQITLQLKVVDAISMAGGLATDAGDEAVIQRASSGGGEETIKINLRELLEEANLALNVVVRGGDVIHIRERLAENVYVLGEVNRAGAYPIPPKQELRISQVFAWAGGPTKTAKLGKGILLRYNERGERQELPVNFSDILKGKKEDFLVQANDIVFVPGSRFKDLGLTLLQGIPGSLASLPFRIP
jgi:polysaccharide export outer membrane protein